MAILGVDCVGITRSVCVAGERAILIQVAGVWSAETRRRAGVTSQGGAVRGQCRVGGGDEPYCCNVWYAPGSNIIDSVYPLLRARYLRLATAGGECRGLRRDAALSRGPRQSRWHR